MGFLTVVLTAIVAVGSLLVSQIAAARALHAAVLPNEAPHFSFESASSRSHTFFATLINDSDSLLQNCRVEMATELPFILDYQVTERVQNRSVGRPNTPAVIAARGLQTFRFSLRLRDERYIEQQNADFRFVCDGVEPAEVVDGINTVQVSAGAPPAPAVLSAIAVSSTSGVLQLDPNSPGGAGEACQLIPYPGGAISNCAIGAYAFALVNASNADLDLEIVETSGMHFSQLCQTNSAGSCVTTAAPQFPLATQLAAGELATFSAYLVTLNDFAFNPFVEFQGAGFQVFERGADRVGSVLTQQKVRAEAEPFEWSAFIDTSNGSDVLRVRGSIWVASGCERGLLVPVFEAGLPADELHLELQTSADHLPPDVACTQAILKTTVNYESTASVDGYDRVVVRHRSNRLTLTLNR